MEAIDWLVKADTNAGVPPGNYKLAYRGWKVFSHANVDGPRLKWAFEVLSGDHKGRIADPLTPTNITPNSPAGVLISGVLGRPLKAGEDPREALKACEGREYLGTVADGPKGGKPQLRKVGPMPEM